MRQIMLTATDLLNSAVNTQIHTLRHGLPAHEVVRIFKHYKLSGPEVASMLGLSLRSLELKMSRGLKLKAPASERLFRLVRVAEHAKAIFKDPISVRNWLSRPHSLLDQATPLSMLDTAYGAQEVERILCSIEYGLPV
jgi:putative toxin-antitoxin system antitoxin component (TIGR02293 family)